MLIAFRCYLRDFTIPMQSDLQEVVQALNKIILGKPGQIKLAIVCLLAKGHLLIEDLPGMGKTTLAHALEQW